MKAVGEGNAIVLMMSFPGADRLADALEYAVLYQPPPQQDFKDIMTMAAITLRWALSQAKKEEDQRIQAKYQQESEEPA